jgi:hypothetical protein
MKSGLDISVLGKAWTEVDQDRRGKISKEQLALILGLLSQAQLGQPVSLETLNPDVPPPNIADF